MKKMIFLLLLYVICAIAGSLLPVRVFSQGRKIYGKVSDPQSHPLAGAAILIKGTGHGTKTNDEGEFTLETTAPNVTLLISHVGYKQKEIKVQEEQVTVFAITLEPFVAEGDEVIVTGVFDKRKRMDASVAITTISSKQISQIVPLSTADLLKNVPGVYVNSSLGEIRNTVYSRGVSVGSNDGASGYYYVSLQEDGLPVTNATFSNYGPDYFLRADATIGKVEAVRGGTASITGANAPGGIFNYVSKEGGAQFGGEIRTKYGLEGNGHSNFYRTDFDLGGPMGHNWFYNVGGFYRYDQGNKNPGYPINNGGQLKGNLIKKYKTGSLKIYGKYLSDHNGWYEFTPTTGFMDPKPAPGFTNYSSVLIPSVQQSFPLNQTGTTDTYRSDNLVHSKDYSVGANWEQRLGAGWSISNASRYSRKNAAWNTTSIVYPFPMDNLTSYAILGLLGQPGTYSVRGLNSGKELLSVTSYSGYDFNVNSSSLPGSAISPNSLFFEPLLYVKNEVKEYTDQFALTKKTENMSFTLGGFYGYYHIDRLNGSAGLGLGTIQDRPELVNITRTNTDGTITHITNSNGVAGVGGYDAGNYATQNQAALFFGHTWQFSSQWNLDWGVRWERVRVSGHNVVGETLTSTTGGLDGDPLTLYDNAYGKDTATLPFGKTLNTFSYSAGLNYKINDHFALYGRYSQGNKAPDLDIYFGANTDFTSQTLNPQAQRTQQVELGLKYKTSAFDLFITPFYSLLSNVPNVQQFQTTSLVYYNAPTEYEKYRTLGIELEGNYRFDQHFSVRAVATLQQSKAVQYNAWVFKGGPGLDSLASFSGNETDNSARTIINITPQYNTNKFYAFATWAYMGKRQANVANAFQLPAFGQVDLGMGYDLSRRLQLSVNVNNLFNKYGVMSWSRPGTFPTALDRQGFTKQMYEDAVKSNAVYSTIAIPARAYFLTATFKF